MTDLRTPLDDWLEDQSRLTAVDRFARWHDQAPSPQERYRELIPFALPRNGEQYAFSVDLDACTGCKACVTACHSLNGLDATESWRSVGLVFGTDGVDAAGQSMALQQSVTTACHHCVDPACMNGCPVNAYEKDPVTGIVSHLDDQCIGCRYCVLTCPYEVPRFNDRLGIVRKCDMCRDRLAESEAPACVQACPNEAIRITVVRQDEIVAAADRGEFLAATPDPRLTAPTTRYVTARPTLASAVASDASRPRLAEGHPPLVTMLVLTQLAVGAAVADAILRLAGLTTPRSGGPLVVLGAGGLALAASVLHLGRPHLAWRALLGLRHSWLSREILAFGVFAALAASYATVSWLPHWGPRWLPSALSLATAGAGSVGLLCSIMIYVVTGRVWWRARFTASKFVLSAAALGPLAVACVFLLSGGIGATNAAASTGPPLGPGVNTVAVARWLVTMSMTACAIKLALEALVLTYAQRGLGDELARTARLQRGLLRQQTAHRFRFGLLGGIALPGLTLLLMADAMVALGVASLGLGLLLLGEFLERSQFFTAAAPPRMPGVS